MMRLSNAMFRNVSFVLFCLFTSSCGAESLSKEHDFQQAFRVLKQENLNLLDLDTITSTKRRVQEIYECGEILDTYNSTEVANVLEETLINGLGPENPLVGSILSFLGPLLKYGIQVRKVCASCSDFEETSEAFQDICGTDVYGSNITFSGLLAMPLSEVNDRILEGTRPGFVYTHPTVISSYPTNNWNGINTNFLTAMYSMIPASSGAIALQPDYMGYGEAGGDVSFKSYIIKKAYQTSTLPLWLKASTILQEETNCTTALADATTVMGYSEGGYAAVAVAEGLLSMGVDIIRVEAGGAPFRIGSIAVPRIVESIDLGTFPVESERKILGLSGSTFSSTNPDVANHEKGQDILETSERDNIVELVAVGESSEAINNAIPLDDPLSIFDEEFVAWARSINESRDPDPCGTNISVGFNDFLCPAFVENDLTETLESVTYHVNLCHTPDDEVVSYENLPDFSKNSMFLSLMNATGSHEEAGGQCLIGYMGFLLNPEYMNWPIQDKHSEAGCRVTPAPSMGATPTSSPGIPTSPPSPTTPSPTTEGTTPAPTSSGASATSTLLLSSCLLVMMVSFLL